MDKTRYSKRRLIENERFLRSKNTHAKEALKNYYRDEDGVQDVPMEFYCECSDDDCVARIELTIHEYESHHKRADRFTVAHDHVMAEIEKLIKTFDDYIVVEKYDLAP